MTDPALWEAAKRLFDEALARDVSTRDTYLQRACEGQPELLHEVRSLIASHRDNTGFLEAPAGHVSDWVSAPDDEDDRAGQSVGAWRIVGRIGFGGMGVVYLAERADDAFRRKAALKIVRGGADSAAIVRRFRRERETLAALDHPNIARLLDGGATTANEPYFVMELVEGLPVDRFADEQRLTIEARLDLFRAICAGVQYAHAHFVVHRDIKPDNILVGRDGVPKLLDFGVAKITHTSTDAESPEDMRTWLMTPEYASPEQLAGGPVTTASDVYSLGVLLYLLLTGLRPYALTGRTVASLHQQLTAVELSPPSVRVARETSPGLATAATSQHVRRAEARSTRSDDLARRLEGDLDAIVMRALARDPAARYTTVAELTEDLDRHRGHRPVHARGRNVAYVAGRFLRRHAPAVAGAMVLLLAGGAGLGLVLRESAVAREARARAERRFDDVRDLARTFMFDVNDALVAVPGTTSARELMVRTAVDYLERLALEAAGDRALQAEVAAGFVRVGDAQGHPSSPNLGDTTGALASYRRAIQLARPIAVSPAGAEASRTLAMAQRKLADVLAQTGDLPAALAEARESERLFAAIGAGAGAPLDDHVQAGIGHIKLGDLLGNPNFPNLKRPVEASGHYATALAAFRRLAARAPDHTLVRRYLGLTLERIGTMHEDGGRWPEALAAYRESYAIRRQLAEAERPTPQLRRDLGVALEKLGNVERVAGRPATALAHYRQALAQFVQLAALDPSDANAARTVAISREKLAGVLVGERDGAREGRALLAAALAGHRDLAGRDRDNQQARCDVSRVSEALGDAMQPSAPYTPIPAARCAAWRESLAIMTALSTQQSTSCAADADVRRLTAKLAACR